MLRGLAGVFLCNFLLIIPVPAQVQTTAEIRGTIQDSTGGRLPGVTVTVKSQETGFTRETVTNDQGYYVFTPVRPGVYSISASLPGFKTAIVTDREVQTSIPAQVNIVLEIGEVTEEITVSAQGEELINKGSAELSTTINQDLVDNLPVETRNYFDLLALAPNTSPQYLSTGNMSFGQHALRRVNAGGSFESSGVFAAGNRDSASNISIDGANQQIAIYNNTVNIQSAATIKELKLQTASANAEFGYGSNAVNVITKSGTNDFHGEVFWQHRNDALDANDFFTNLAGRDVPEYKRNKFGASLGGPIIRDKLLFFGNYEGGRLRQSVQGNAQVPTAELKKGDFSNFRPLKAGGGLGPTPVIYNPFDFDPATGLRRPFPGNKIPANLLDPAMQTLLEFTPLPNTVIDEVPQYSGLIPSLIDENQYTGRVDWEKSDRTTIYGRHTFAERKAVRGGLLPLMGEDTPSNTYSTVLNWTQILSPALVNDFSASYTRLKWGIGRPLDVPDVAQQMKLTNISGIPGSPNISVPNIAVANSGQFTWDPTQHTYQLKDDLSYTFGRHSLKWGAHVTERRLFFIKESGDKGRFVFDNVFSRACPLGSTKCEQARTSASLEQGGYGFADLLMGTSVESLLIRRPIPWHGHQRYYGSYFQDTWQVHSRLTLNLGLRYEYWNPWLLPRNAAVRYDLSGAGALRFALQNPLDVFNPATEYGRQGKLNPDMPREGYETTKLNLAPRIGFAFTLTPDTVIRAAGGIFYAGNINTNQQSDQQMGGAPFTTRVEQTIARSEQLPPLIVRGHFPVPAPDAIPGPGDIPPASPRALGESLYPTPAVYQWSLSVQHRLTSNWSVHLDYLGSHSIHEAQFVDLNAPALPQGDLAKLTLQQRRRFPGWGRWGGWVPWGYGKYNSATWGIRNREWRGLSFMANFQWAKNLTSSKSLIDSDQGNLDFRNWDIWRGRSNFYPTARFVSGWSYKLPFGPGRAFGLNGVPGALVNGWIISGITEFSTGAPVTVTTSDNSGTGLGQLADRLGGCRLDEAARDRFSWFNTGCFAQPQFGTWGKSSQGILNDPGINNWNINLAKTFFVNETHQLEFRVESFNIFNHTQWGRANTALNNNNFGRIVDTRPARQLQFALFYNF